MVSRLKLIIWCHLDTLSGGLRTLHWGPSPPQTPPNQGNRGNREVIKLINYFFFVFLFFIYGSWEALDRLKSMPQGMGTFSDIETFILRTCFVFLHFWELPSDPKEDLEASSLRNWYPSQLKCKFSKQPLRNR